MVIMLSIKVNTMVLHLSTASPLSSAPTMSFTLKAANAGATMNPALTKPLPLLSLLMSPL